MDETKHVFFCLFLFGLRIKSPRGVGTLAQYKRSRAGLAFSSRILLYFYCSRAGIKRVRVAFEPDIKYAAGTPLIHTHTIHAHTRIHTHICIYYYVHAYSTFGCMYTYICKNTNRILSICLFRCQVQVRAYAYNIYVHSTHIRPLCI